MKLSNVIIVLLVATQPLIAIAGSNAGSAAPVASTQNRPISGPINLILPRIPPEAFYSGLNGVAVACFTVKADGTVANARVKSLPYTPSSPMMGGQVRKELAQSMLTAVKQWKFIPQLVNGKPVATLDVCRQIKFSG
ncbi:MAG: energy transducer TonB [Terriglobia bacterium]